MSATLRAWARLRVFALPTAALLAVTLPHLGDGDWRTDTGRYAAIGLQAWRSLGEGGGGFWTLRTHPDHPWFNKPPLAIWIHGLSLRLLGVDLLAARLPSVLAAALTLAGTLVLVRTWHIRGVAVATGLVLALTYGFFRRVREVSLDLWQVAFMIAAIALLVRAAAAVGRGPRARLAVGGGGCVGLALLCKPFVGFGVIPVFAVWLLIERRWRDLWLAGLAAAAALAVAAPWHVSMAWIHGEAFTGQYVGAEVADRAAGGFGAEPPWYYLAILGSTYWPWLVPLVLSLVWLGRRGWRAGDAGLRLAALWLAAWLAALSLFPDKAPRYAVVLYPASAWLAGAWLAAHPAFGQRLAVRRGSAAAVGALAVGAAVFAALPVDVQRGENPAWSAAIEFVRERPERPLASIGLDTNQAGRFYLAGLGWPEPVADASTAPPNAIIVRTPDFDETIPDGERVLFREERVALTEPSR